MKQPALPSKRPEGMDLCAVATTPALEPKPSEEALEISQYISMAPQPKAIATRTMAGAFPAVGFPLSLQFFQFHMIIQYYVYSLGSRHLWLEAAPLSFLMMPTYYYIM